MKSLFKLFTMMAITLLLASCNFNSPGKTDNKPDSKSTAVSKPINKEDAKSGQLIVTPIIPDQSSKPINKEDAKSGQLVVTPIIPDQSSKPINDYEWRVYNDKNGSQKFTFTEYGKDIFSLTPSYSSSKNQIIFFSNDDNIWEVKINGSTYELAYHNYIGKIRFGAFLGDISDVTSGEFAITWNDGIIKTYIKQS